MGVDVVLGQAGDMSKLGIYESFRVGSFGVACIPGSVVLCLSLLLVLSNLRNPESGQSDSSRVANRGSSVLQMGVLLMQNKLDAFTCLSIASYLPISSVSQCQILMNLAGT